MVVVEAATAVAVTAKFSQKGPLNQRAFCFSDLLASDFSCQAPRRPSNTPNPNYINRIDKISTLHGIMAKIAIMDMETQNRTWPSWQSRPLRTNTLVNTYRSGI